MHLATLLSTFYAAIAILLWISVVAINTFWRPHPHLRLTLGEYIRIALLICIWPITLTVWFVVGVLSLDVNRKIVKSRTGW